MTKIEVEQPVDQELGTSPITDEKMEDEVEVKTSSVAKSLLKLFVCCVMGLLFGGAFARSRVFEPKVIRSQFNFSAFTMLAMFLGAAMASSFTFFVISFTPWKFKFEKIREKKESSFIGRTYIGVAFGSALTGLGMSVGGACPGMVLAQIGAGVEYSYLTFIGGFVGALIHGLTEPWHNEKTSRKPDSLHREKSVFFGASSEKLTLTLLLGYTLACLGVVIALELLFPWEEQFESFPTSNGLNNTNLPDCNWFANCRAIPPSVAGVVLGFLQVPALLGLGTLLGSSTSYSCIMSVWTNFSSTATKEKFAYMAKYGKPDFATWWQVLYVGSAVLGAYVAELSAGGIINPPGVGPIASFLGGLLMVFGSRYANGCTSGHGISGMASLLKHSFVAVFAMFGTGIASAFIWEAVAPGTYL